MTQVVEQAQLANRISCDSAGTGAWHSGERADARMRRHAAARGYKLTSRARQVLARDFDDFDYILGMDHDNYRHLQGLMPSGDSRASVCLFTEFCVRQQYDGVPDPYYGGDAGFELVLDIIEDGCQGLLRDLQQRFFR